MFLYIIVIFPRQVYVFVKCTYLNQAVQGSLRRYFSGFNSDYYWDCKNKIHFSAFMLQKNNTHFFDLYEGMWRNQRLIILSTLGTTVFLVEKEQYLFLNSD